MARADFEAMAANFGIPVPQAEPCQGCSASWVVLSDGTAERAHQKGCPWQPNYPGSTQGVTEVLQPTAVQLPRTPKSSLGDMAKGLFTHTKDDE